MRDQAEATLPLSKNQSWAREHSSAQASVLTSLSTIIWAQIGIQSIAMDNRRGTGTG